MRREFLKLSLVGSLGLMLPRKKEIPGYNLSVLVHDIRKDSSEIGLLFKGDKPGVFLLAEGQKLPEGWQGYNRCAVPSVKARRFVWLPFQPERCEWVLLEGENGCWFEKSRGASYEKAKWWVFGG